MENKMTEGRMSGLNEEESFEELRRMLTGWQDNVLTINPLFFPNETKQIRRCEAAKKENWKRKKQAHNQLVEIVREHFKRKEFTKGYEIIQIQQKPRISREALHQLFLRFYHDEIWFPEVDNFFKELGVEVVEE